MTGLAMIFAIALLLDFLFGDPHSPRHPVALAGRLAGWVETGCRKRFGDGVKAGLIGWLAVLFAGLIPVALSVLLIGRLPLPHCDWLAAGAWLYVAIALKSLIQHAEAIREPLAVGALDKARAALAMVVSRDTDFLFESEIARGAIESIGENIVDAVDSAFFWAALGYVAAGPAGAALGAMGLRIVNTLDASWGYRNDRYRLFGRVAARADDFAHWLPARLALPLIALASRSVGGSFRETWRVGWKHRRQHPSPNSGYGMAAFAGALKLRLGGPTVYNRKVEDYPYWGDGRPELTAKDIARAERLAAVSGLLFAAVCWGGASLLCLILY